MAEIDWVVLGPLLAKMLADVLAAEQSRSGLTTEEIFDRAGHKLDENEAKLLEDLARLQVTE
jgi:hypothetical protein